MQGRGAPHSLVSVMRLPFVITTIMIMIAETARFLLRAFGKITDTEYREYESRALALRPGRFLFLFLLFPPLLRPSMCSSRSGLLSARRGARIKSIPSRRAKRRRTHRHRRQSKDRHRRAKRRRVPPRSRRKEADEKQETATRIQNLSMPSQRDGPRPAGRAAQQSSPAPP